VARLSWPTCTRTQWVCATARQDAERLAAKRGPQRSRPRTAAAAGARRLPRQATRERATEEARRMQAA